MPTSLSLHDVHFSWPDGATVLDGLGLAVGPGRAAGEVIGVAGSGRTK